MNKTDCSAIEWEKESKRQPGLGNTKDVQSDKSFTTMYSNETKVTFNFVGAENLNS